MNDLLKKYLTINEIFCSIQGESYLAGLPCVFVRLTGCHQRCTYCDTEYAFYEGQKMTIANILAEIEKYGVKNVLLTGGEPLLQDNCKVLAQILIEQNYQVSVETGGNRDITVLPANVIKIMDLKTPASSEAGRNNYDNVPALTAKDEVKFVIMDQTDLDWSLATVERFKLDQICHVSFSPTNKELLPILADAIVASKKPIRLQVQFHKIIWPEKDRGY